MLNSCSIAYAKEVEKVGVERVVSQLEPFAKENGLTLEEIRTKINSFYKEYNGHSEMDCHEGIRNLFRSDRGLDLKLLRDVKYQVRDLLISEIFGGDPVFTNKELEGKIEDLIYINKKYASKKPELEYDILINGNISKYSPDEIAQYLIGNHFPLLVKTWFSDFLTIGKNGNYEFIVKTQVRQDYNTDAFEDKPAEMPNVVELLLSNTTIRDFYRFDGTDKGTISSGTQTLTRNAFFYAVRHTVEKMNKEEYQKFVENPLYIFDYVLSKNKLNEYQINDLSSNILASFATKWLYKTVKDSSGVRRFERNNFYKTMIENATANTSNVVHMIAAAINKYTDNTFLDVSLNSKDSGDLSISVEKIDMKTILGQPFGQLQSRIEYLKNTEGSDNLTQLLRDWNTKTFNDKLKVIRTIFDSPKLYFDEHVCNDLYAVFNRFNRSDEENFKEFLSEDSKDKNTIEQHILSANRTNVYLPKGSRSNVAGKQLPIYGINSAAADIKLEVVRTIIRQQENDLLYTGQIAGLKRVNACQHSWLYNHSEKSPKTVYFSTIRSNVGGQEIVKEFAQLSVGEAFRLSFDTFLNENLLRIQAITPSDKVRIPMHEFTADFFLEGKTALTLDQMIENVELLYRQSILNSIIDIHVALDPTYRPKSTDIKNWTVGELEQEIEILNAKLETVENIDVLNRNLQKFNELYGTNKSLARVLDVDHEDDGTQIKVAKSNLLYLKELSNPDHWKNMYLASLKDLQKELPKFSVEDKTIKELISDVENGRDYKNTKLYEYFIKSIFAKENVLINTVGLPLAHKGKGNNWAAIDSGKHLTMTKRMVAMTSTSHYCIKGLNNGLPNKINTLTFDSGSLPMFVYSGDTANGSSSEQQHDTWDGIMLGTRAVDNLMKESITDVKPKGNMLKVLLPALSEEKAGAYLAKLAQCTIDNAFLRTFANEDNEIVGATNPMVIMQLSFQNVEIEKESVLGGRLIKGKFAQNIVAYKNIDGNIFKLKSYDINFAENEITAVWTNTQTGQEYVYEAEGCNLFNLWKVVLGGEWSCSRDGVYGEQSQDTLTQVLIDTRNAKGKQYLKENIIHYFPSLSVQKSTQAPVVKDLHAAQQNKELIFTVKMDIDRMGIQLDADHEAEDAQIREVSQLMNNLAEGAYTPEKTKLIYEKLASLADSLQDFLDYSKISGAEGSFIKEQLGKIFQPRIKRIFADPTLDVMGLANEIAIAIKEYDAQYKTAHNGESLLMPVSDRQVLSKYHTTVGSMLNKYIARKWTGRGDVLAPSTNLCMKYHYKGINYLMNDYVYEIDPDNPAIQIKIPVKQFLHNVVWNSNGTFNQEFVEEYRITSGSEIMPEDVLYRVDPETGSITAEVVNYKSKGSFFVKENGFEEDVEGFDKMMLISSEIDSGVLYFRAIDLPQNLRSKRVFANISWNSIREFEDVDTGELKTVSIEHSRKIGVYHFQTYKMLQLLGKLLDGKTLSDEMMLRLRLYIQNHSSDIIRNKLSALNSLDIKKIYELKKAIQYYFSRDLLPELNSSVVSERLLGELNASITIRENDTLIPARAALSVEMSDDEKFTTNNYSHIFGDGMNLSEILQKGEKWFRKSLDKKFLKTNIGDTEVTLYSYGSTPINVSSDKSLIEKYKLHQVDPEIDDEGYILNAGKRTFKLPKDAKLYSDSEGVTNMLLIDPEQLPTVVSKLVKQKHFFAYRKGQTNSEIDSILAESNIYEIFENDEDNNVLFDSLAKRQFDSFKETLRSLQARIPSQSLSFAMAMRTVGFLPWDTNTTMVANSNVFIEGSDYDIDKVYSIMFHLNEVGLIDGVNDRNLVVTTNIANHPEIGFSIEEKALNDSIWNLTLSETDELFELGMQSLVQQTMELLSIRPSTNSSVPYRVVGSDLRIDKDYLYDLAEKYVSVNYDPNESDLQQEYLACCEEIDYIIEHLQKRISDISRLDYTRDGDMTPVQNNLLIQMIGVFDDIRTLVATTTPTTMYPLKSTISQMPLGKELRNHHNFMTDFNVNKTAYTGKKDVGIAATGQKSLMGITQYYSTLYTQNKNLAHEFSFDIPSSWQYYTNSKGSIVVLGENFTNFVLPGQKLNLATLEYLAKSGVLRRIEGGYRYYDKDNSKRVLNVGDVLDITSATDINSAFISAATDNAKEMLLDSLNASQEVLPAFVFGVSKGVPLDLLTVMFTDELIPFMLNKLRGNIFDGTASAPSMSSLLSSEEKRENILNEFIDIQKELGLTFESEEEWIIYREELSKKLEVYTLFFDGASQMRTIGGTLSINGGIDVHNGASIEWMMRIQNTINSTRPKGTPNFSIEEFLFADQEHRMEMCNLYRGDRAFTVLDVLTVVPHYASMCKVPYLYKLCVESTSKDIEILHRYFKNIAEKNIFKTLKMENLPNALRIINQVKIFEFLRELDFAYTPDTVYSTGYNNADDGENIELRTSTPEGLFSLKKYIEENIISTLKENYPTNPFVNNLVFDSIFLTLFNRKMEYWGSKINLGDKQYEDQFIEIKLAYDQISQEVINGHTIGEWMFLYDLIVNQHNLGGTSLTMCFGSDINVLDENNLIYKWINFIQRWDSSTNTIKVNELYKSPDLDDIDSSDKESPEDYFDYSGDFMDFMPIETRGWSDPSICPLFVKFEDRFENFSPINTSLLLEAFSRGRIFVTLC